MVKSPLSDVVIPDVPFHQLAFDSFERHGNKVALVDGVTDKQYTYAQLLRMCKNAASGLVRLGVRKSDVIGMFSQNSPEYAVVFLAASACGATVTTINPSYTVYELKKQLDDSDARFIYTTSGLLNKVREAAKQYGNIQSIIVQDNVPGYASLGDLLSDNGSRYPTTLTFDTANDLLTLPYSSGTTGVPKGVMLTHRNLVANFSQLSHPDCIPDHMKEFLSKNPDFQRVTMVMLPMFHMLGQSMLLNSLLRGYKIVTLPRFIPEKFLGAIEKYRVQQLTLVPPLVIFLAKSPLVDKYDLSSVIVAGCGAAPLAKDMQLRACKRLGVRAFGQGYGLTETAPGATGACFLPGYGIRPGSVGVPVPNTQIQIVDQDTNKVLGPMQAGEVWIRGPQVMKGYLKKPEATKNTLDEQGWLHTGDKGYLDKDGYLYIMDRIKELIKYKGFQVAPAELEGLLINHPGIDDVGVLGVPDNEAGELPKAMVVRKHGVPVTKQQIHEYVNEHLSNHKRLRGGIEFVDKIPKSDSGKILRRQLDAMANKKSKL